MKKSIRLISSLILVLVLVCCLAACGPKPQPTPDPPQPDPPGPSQLIDYAGQVSFDPDNCQYAHQEVTVHQYIDGDTTHFNVPKSVRPNGILKARYIAVNTPESTGKIEDYGHMASRYTYNALSTAKKIYIESDTTTWNPDSTGDRFIVWIWYIPENGDTYRNLNIELLQEGLARASDTGGNRYGTIAMNALNQARDAKLYVHGSTPDPEIYRGSAYQISIAELIGNIDKYLGKDVAVEGFITNDYGSKIYFEAYDETLDMMVGFNAYYGYSAPGAALEMFSIGNHVRIVGTVQEFNGTYQISGLDYYDPFLPDQQEVCKLVDDQKMDDAYQLVDAATFVNGNVNVDVLNNIDDVEEGYTTKSLKWAQLAISARVELHELKVVSIYTTDNGGDSDGAMTLTCKAGDITVSVRTEKLYLDGKLVTEDMYMGKTINVKGVVDYFNGYQIKVFDVNNITIVG